MKTRDLVIELIRQDMKHQQLVEAICRAGFETDLHHLHIMPLVARLMYPKETEPEAGWIETYMECLGAAARLPIAARAENLRSAAEECYLLLRLRGDKG